MQRHRDDSFSSSPVVTDFTETDLDITVLNEFGAVVSHVHDTTHRNYGHYPSVVKETWARSMDDVVSTGNGADHPCYQLTTERSLYEALPQSTVNTEYNPSSRRTTITHVTCQGGPGSYDWVGLPVPYAVDLVADTKMADCILAHRERCTHACKQIIPMGNFLIELPEIKRLVNTLKEAFEEVDAYLFRQKIATDSVLAWNFGVKPFISDLKHLVNFWDDVQRQTKALMDLNGRKTEIVTNRNVPIVHGLEAHPAEPSLSTTSNKVVWHEIDSHQAHVWISSKVSFDLRDLTQVELTAYAAARGFGFSNPAKILWNAIPYSFVLDWIYPVSKCLDYIDLSTGFIPSYISGTTSHAKVTSEARQYVKIFETVNDPTVYLQAHKNGVDKTTIYRRWVGLPPASLTPEVPSPFQQLLGSLLAAQLLDPSKRPKIPRLRRKDWLKNMLDGKDPIR